jgi:hypothetical protein
MRKVYFVSIDLSYVGYDMKCLLLSDENSVRGEVTNLAIEHHSSYNIEDDNFRPIEVIMEEDSVDREEAEYTQTDEILSTMDIEFETYNPQKHGNYNEYDMVGFDGGFDMVAYLRDNRISEILK